MIRNAFHLLVKNKNKKSGIRWEVNKRNLFSGYIGCLLLGFDSRRVARVASLAKSKVLLLLWTQLIQAGCKINLPQAKAEPISEAGGTSEKTCLWWGKIQHNSKEKMCKTTLPTPRSEKEEGVEVLQVPEQKFTCSLGRGPWWRRYSHCSPWRSVYRSRWAFLERNCSAWRGHGGADLSWRTAAHRKPMLERGRSVRRKVWQGGTLMGWPRHPSFPCHCTTWGRRR